MRQLVIGLAVLIFAAGVCIAEEPVLKTQKDKVSYVIGMFVGKDMKNQGIDLNSDVFVKGFRDALADAKPALSDQEAQEVMKTFRTEMTAKKQAEMKKLGEENKKKSEAFLAENKKKPGVQTLPSGLQYKVIKEGTGNKPTAYDNVTVHYRGTLVDGTEFDSSYKRNEPAKFPVTGVIPGWTEALQLMKTGSKWQLFIPSNLAYGEAGAGRAIPPNAALVFDVELVSIASVDGQAAPKTNQKPGKGTKGGK
jgi:FKBP-type peptidyl-prolyl cis-trans isomerase FklB